jgi:hypothetical protein
MPCESVPYDIVSKYVILTKRLTMSFSTVKNTLFMIYD